MNTRSGEPDTTIAEPSQEPPPRTGFSVRARTAENVAILLAIQWMIRGFAIATKIILARVLFPQDFGIFALATGLIGFASALGNFGLDFAVIQRGDSVREEDYDVAMSLRVVVSLALLAATVALALPWSILFGNPAITGATQGLAIVYLVSPWGFVPTTKLMARLEYRRLVVPNLLGQVANSGLAIALAALGFGFWALVAGTVASQIAWVLSVSVSQPWRFRFRLNRVVAKSLLAYSRHLVLASVLAFLMTNVDNFTVGYLLGSSMVGYYAVAYSFSLLSSVVSGSAASALFPSLSKIQLDFERVRRGYIESFGYAAATIAPIAIGLAVMAPEIVRVLLGPTWAPSIVPLFILSLYGCAKALVEFSSPLFASLGRPSAISRLNAMILAGSIVLLYPLTRAFGITGTAFAMSIPVFAATAISIWWASRLLDVRPRDLAVRLRGPLLAAEAAGVVAFFSKWFLSPWLGPPGGGFVQDLIVFLAATIIGSLAYIVSLKVVDPNVYSGLFRQLRLIIPIGSP